MGYDEELFNKIMKDKNITKHERYCSHCGLKMIETLVGAETNMMFYGDMSSIPFGSAYDEKTGERQFCYKYICPCWKKKLWGLLYSKHDNYFVNKIVKV